MNLETYRAEKQKQKQAEEQRLAKLRSICPSCRKVPSTCYCAQIKPFNAGPKFVILIHPKENKKRIGTGRLTRLCIKNSVIVECVDFSQSKEVNDLIADPANWPVVLYPGRTAVDVGSSDEVETMVPQGKQLVIFVVDGSWFLAKKMLRLSHNLLKLPQIKFTPSRLSIYQIRRQPKAICFSSIEAVHFIIEQLQSSKRWQSDAGYDNLIQVFKYMIQQQLQFVSNLRRVAVRGDRKVVKS